MHNISESRVETPSSIRYRDQDGRLHREDGPAVTFKRSGDVAWYIHGRLHREDGPASIAKDGKNHIWYQHGKIHRDDGPAVMSPDSLSYFQDGSLHREDGPAVIKIHHDCIEETYYIDGKKVDCESLLYRMMIARYESHGGFDKEPFDYLKEQKDLLKRKDLKWWNIRKK